MRFISPVTKPAMMLSALAVLLASCDRSAPQESLVTSRDSAGIAIIESSESLWPEDSTWTLSDEPLVRIGTVEGDLPYLFSDVEGVLLRPDGGLIVADRGSSEVRYFDSNGGHEYSVGRPGEGPGEFSYIRGMGYCGADSLFVFEIDHEFKVFTAEGEYVRQARPFDTQTVDRRPYQLRCGESGYYVAVGWEPRVASGQPSAAPRPTGFYRAEAPVWILAPNHIVESGIASIEHAQLTLVSEIGTFLSSERIGTANGSGPHPFGRSLQLAVAENGILLGTGESSEIRQYSFEGSLERIIRWPATDLMIGSEDLAAYRTAELEAVGANLRPAMERRLAEMPLPPAFPAYTRIEVDAHENVWVSEFAKPSKPDASWLVLDRRGEFLGRVRVPLNLEITDIGSDRLAGIQRDDLGVERVVVYELRKPGK
jgi:hypothetical protein